jgi:STE24 endopeptidase
VRTIAAAAALAVTLSVLLAAAGQSVTPPPAPESGSTMADEGTAPVAVPEPSATAMTYYRTGVAWWVGDTLWGFLIPGVILFTGFSARMRDWAGRLGRRWIVPVYFAIFSLVTFAIDLPRSYFEDFARQHAYGLSNQTLGKWFGDSMTALLVSIVIGALVLWVPYLLLRKSPRRWWLYTGLLAVPFVCVMMLVTPVWIDPLFNTYGPMKDKALEADILRLAERAGIEGGRVYEVDKSVDTNAINAYVAGIGSTKRIVLWDTIIKRLDRQELLFVMGHEMGHYVLGHTWRIVGLLSCTIMLMLFLIHRSAGWLLARYGARFGFHELSDVASMPMLVLLFSLGFLVAQPFALGYIRHLEHEADRFGLEITHANRAAAVAFVKMQQDNLANPRPGWLMTVMRASHPTLADRIEFCNTYRPWAEGQPPVYQHLFR